MSKIRRLLFAPLRLAFALLPIFAVSQGVAAAGPADRSGGEQSTTDRRTIEGTWRVEITLRSCLTGEAVQAPFPALASFARGGTVTTADGGSSPVMRGTGLGAWWRVRRGVFWAITEAFLFNGGVRGGMQQITQEIEVVGDGEEFSANVTSEIQDVDGNVLATGCATSIGRKL